MNYDRTCSTCRYHDEGMCYCPKSEEFRDDIHRPLAVHHYVRYAFLIALGDTRAGTEEKAHYVVVPAEDSSETVVTVHLAVVVEILIYIRGNARQHVVVPLALLNAVIEPVRISVEVVPQILVVVDAGQISRAIDRVVADKGVDAVVSDGHLAHIPEIPPRLVKAEIRRVGDVQIKPFRDKLSSGPLGREKGVVGRVVREQEL